MISILQSVDEGSESCIEGIRKYFTAHNLLPMSPDGFVREHLGDMKSAITGLMVMLVRHAGKG